MITEFFKYLNEAIVHNNEFNSKLPIDIKFTIDISKSKEKDRLKIVREFEKYFILSDNTKYDITSSKNNYLTIKFYDTRIYKNILETRKNLFTYNFSFLKPDYSFILSIEEFIDVGLIDIRKYIELKKDVKIFNL